MTDNLSMKLFKAIFRFIAIFTTLIVPFYTFAQESQKESQQQPPVICAELLDWIYKDLTLQNLDQSIERTKTKMFMGLLQTLQNTNGVNLKYEPELVSLWKSLSEIDPKVESYLDTNSSFTRYRFWNNRKYKNLDTFKFFDAISNWKKLQENKPELFKGLDSKYLLDKWDLVTADLVDNISGLDISDQVLKQKLNNLSMQLNHTAQNTEKAIVSAKDITDLKTKFDLIQKGIYQKSSDLYMKYLDDYKHVCGVEDISANDSIHLENYLCRIDAKEIEITPMLIDIANVVKQKNLNTIDQPAIPPLVIEIPPKDEIDSLEIKKIDYIVNDDPDAFYCIRDPEVVDSLTIHHTATSKETSPEEINEGHIARSTDGDPWYMIGYNYLVSESAYGGSESDPAIIQGRPPEVRGAHAGGFTKKLTKSEITNLSKQKIKCGRDNNFEEHSMLEEIENGTISGNITSIGIAIIGNYETRYTVNTGGVVIFRNYQGGKKVKFPSNPTLNKVAQLACKLQRQHPNIKKLHPHSYFKNTNCPGSVIGKLQYITDLANKIDGCHFNSPELRK